MKKPLVTFILGVLVGSIFFGATAMLAETGTRNISADFSNIKVVVNGKLMESPVEPFLYNGRVFVPLRFVGEALGQNVNWEDNTVLIAKEKQSLRLADVVTPSATNGQCFTNGSMQVSNQSYDKGFYIVNRQSWNEREGWGYAKVDFHLENKGIKQISGKIGIDDSNARLNESVFVSITADGKKVWEGKIKKGDTPQDIEINPTGVKSLSFVVGAPEKTKVDFIDFKVKY